MTLKQIEQIFKDTAYIRTGGSAEELKCAEYIVSKCAEMGLSAALEPFEVDMATMKQAKLIIDGREIPCKGYLNAGCADIEAPLCYIPSTDAYSMSLVKDKIVLMDSGVSYWVFKDLMENGALGYITHDGNANYADRDIDQKELRGYVSEGAKLPGVNINIKDAIAIVNSEAKTAHIILEQDEYKGTSHNVVLDMPGDRDEYIVLSAHYDSTSLSQGAYDNMSGSVGLLGIAEYFANNPHSYGLRFVWCGSEERGLLGSKAYVAAHEEELAKFALNINLDMIGSIMGKFFAACTTEDKLVSYIKYFALEHGVIMDAVQEVYSSDSTPFADNGVPAVSFARHAPQRAAEIHNSYDTMAVMSWQRMAEDIDFLCRFTSRMANAVKCPVAREIPENMKEKLDIYLNRKRDKK
ncbi:MAG: DUF4910 domain-containing protein [Ruminococcaceae bacterium]|nr:DUF4910 domain-containing protein [Oscillospiraceae bacterium]